MFVSFSTKLQMKSDMFLTNEPISLYLLGNFSVLLTYESVCKIKIRLKSSFANSEEFKILDISIMEISSFDFAISLKTFLKNKI